MSNYKVWVHTEHEEDGSFYESCEPDLIGSFGTLEEAQEAASQVEGAKVFENIDIRRFEGLETRVVFLETAVRNFGTALERQMSAIERLLGRIDW